MSIDKLDEGGFKVTSRNGKNLGTFRTRDEAVKRLEQVEFFKKQSKKNKLLRSRRNGGVDRP